MALNISGLVINNNYNKSVESLAADLHWSISNIKEISFDDALSSKIPSNEFRVYFGQAGAIIFSNFDFPEEENYAPSANSMNFAYSETAMHFYYDHRDLNEGQRVFHEAEREVEINTGKALSIEDESKGAEENTLEIIKQLLGNGIFEINSDAKAYSFERQEVDLLSQHIQYVKLNRKKILNLSSFELESLPGQIFEFDWLEELLLGFHYGKHDVRKIKACRLKSIPTEIGKLTNLKRLTLSGDVFGKEKPDISDFTPLKSLKTLQLLALNNTSIENLDFLSELGQLNNLQLEGTKVSDFSVLATLKNLNILYLGSNELNDINFLEKTTGLTEINLSTNNIESLKPLKNNLHLQKICYCKNGKHLSEELKLLQGLKEICISGITDFNDIQHNIHLEELTLDKFEQSQSSILSNFSALKTLNIDEYEGDIFELPHSTSLKSVTIHGAFSAILGTKHCPNLEELYSRSSNLNMIDFQQNSALEKLSIMHSNINNLDGISQLTNLVELDLTTSKVTSLEPIEFLKSLKKLSIKGSKVSTLEPILHLLTDDFNLELTHMDSPLLAKLGMKPKVFPSELPKKLIAAFDKNGIEGVLEYYDKT